MEPTQYTFEYEPSTNKQMALETAEALNIALADEYGNGGEFQVLLANRCEAAIEKFGISTRKSIHLGCGTGRLTAHISRRFDRVRTFYNMLFVLYMTQISTNENIWR